MSEPAEVRPSSPDELEAIRALAVRSGLFAPDEAAEVIAEVADADGAFWLSAVDPGGTLLGAAYTVAEPVSDGVWNMLFLAVDPDHQGLGFGRALVAAAESRLRAGEPEPGSALVIETSSGDSYASARAFYAGLGYQQVGQVPRYYGPDEDKVVLWKPLA